MAALLHLKSLREDANRRDTAAVPLSASWAKALALSRSTRVKSRLVAKGEWAGFGRREKSGSRRGAWW
jgi:hypothetical protein